MNFATALTSLKTKSLPYLEKVKVYGEKALDFTAKQVATTPLFLKTEEEYNILASAKRSIFLAYDESHLEIKNKALMFPIWG